MSHLTLLESELNSVVDRLSVDYWDVRIEDTFETNLIKVDGEVVNCSSSPSVGAFIRVNKNGFWLYESTTELNQISATLKRLSEQKINHASVVPPSGSKTKTSGPALPDKNHYVALNAKQDNFSLVSMDDKLKLLNLYDAAIQDTPNLVSRTLRYKDVYKVKTFTNSQGTSFEYDFNQGGIGIDFTLKAGESLFEDRFNCYGACFEDLKGQSEPLLKHTAEAQKFLAAPAIAPGKYQVILSPEVCGVFTHESFGHKSEADFMLGNPEALEEWKVGKKIAADCLTIVDHGGVDHSSGYCPIDDDGTYAQKNYLIKNGILTGRLHSRETADALGEQTTGNSRAMNFEFEPIVRMTSTYIEPGTEPIADILKRCEGAIYVEGVKHGSGMSTFTIAPVRGYRIGKDGIKEPVRVTVLSGSVFDTLKNVEAVSMEFQLKSSAIGGCGKMEQWPLPVAYGGSFVVVSEMQVS